jgi:hypothetical protein
MEIVLMATSVTGYTWVSSGERRPFFNTAQSSLRNEWLVARSGASTLLYEATKAAMGSVAAGIIIPFGLVAF